jgi:cytochrome b pre-mRNA-processing protein 3
MVISFSKRRSIRDAAELAYRRVVDQARQPIFFARYGVPDSVDGRFELVCLHAFLYLHRLKSERPQASRLCQSFFDTMFLDLDRALREMGTGDLSVGRQIKRMAQGFYGRIQAYEEGIGGDDWLLRGALARNLFGTVPAPAPHLGVMADYVRAAAADLRRQTAGELAAGRVQFIAPPPQAERSTPAESGSSP